MDNFSLELISKYQEYMLKAYRIEISDSKAQLDLESLSSLYLSFSKVMDEDVQK
jgi:hypothetical protein